MIGEEINMSSRAEAREELLVEVQERGYWCKPRKELLVESPGRRYGASPRRGFGGSPGRGAGGSHTQAR